ncbi:MAG TPA: alpha-1,4-glucan--maltose-1-phosphate maltosyltransferase [Streptosporangiaceae bacterium]|nr:alpha-1,4-glucan--maltose-1-phosphate maltosyltransferase [Streptosporangiaceae bacterium]
MIGRIPILDLAPVVECGQRPAKAVTGETFQVSATVFREGHGAIAAAAVLRDPAGNRGPLMPMTELAPGTDRYGADVTVGLDIGTWRFHVEAWADPIASWLHDAAIKVPRGQDVELMLTEGAMLFERAARNVPQPLGSARGAKARFLLKDVATRLRDRALAPWDRLAAAETPEVASTLKACPLRDLLTRSRSLRVRVDRERALFGSWYEFFPRSEGVDVDPMGRREPVSGTFRTAARRLEAIAAMGFDVVYLPPVHPIGTTFRKGRNNTLIAQPGDPGSPWAIGAAEGGHDSLHPDLGTWADFDWFVAKAAGHGLEVALDLALQCSPDHPWVKEHPEWFTSRADGSIAYAENPPKKYQDIYPVNFDNDPAGIYAEVSRVVRLWMSHGVRIFRVDNPHTKPLRFWEGLLADIRSTDPDVLFLAEAFTRPAMMGALGKVGFHQSYTYFTWRNTAEELTAYLRELAGPASAYMRPNFFANTPDILSEYLQHGGLSGFRVRATLAAMLTPTWGIYSGFELGEHMPLRPGSEEYLDSEKYQYKLRDWNSPDSIAPFITRLNEIRNSHPALRQLRNLKFHHIDQPDLLCFSKQSSTISGETGTDSRLGDTVLVVVNLDPYQTREATVWLDLPGLGVAPHSGEHSGGEFTVTDELTGEAFRWGLANYVRLDPAVRPAHIFSVTRLDHLEIP